MSVTRDHIRKIADLAELGVDDAAAAELEGQLSRILDFVAQLAEVPTDGNGVGDERSVRLRRDDVAPDPLLSDPNDF
ncbi:MAG: Asp-tRNA(Asn)/Glu-tRNA(Gln) amidotransferase subunit GatC, partial [Gemmatimonadales bacterium]|nr:Asp-tRNA(Asn)/Glu-tRNA(Gln) amidotransferase subunit GatC [Gemmatimonadales bacterium]